MIIRVDKCHTKGIMKKYTTWTQSKPKLYVNNEVIPPLKVDESFKYLGRYFNFSMNNQKHKEELLETTTTTLNNISKLSKYFLSKLSWYLTITDIF